jgi:hypothetical protein
MTLDEFRKLISGKAWLISNNAGSHLSFTHNSVKMYPSTDKDDRVPWLIFPVPAAINSPKGDLYYITNQWQGTDPNKLDARYGNSLSFTGLNAELYPNDNLGLIQWQIIPLDPWYAPDRPIVQIKNQWNRIPGDNRIDLSLGVLDKNDPNCDVTLIDTHGPAPENSDVTWFLSPFPYLK